LGPAAHAVARWVIRYQEPFAVRDLGSDGRVGIDGRMAAVAFPLICRGRTVGAVVGIDKRGAADVPRFAPATRVALEHAIEPAAIALENAIRVQRAEALSVTDDLTSLYNSRYLSQVLRRETKRASRSGRPLSLLFMDLDGFKAINDTHGHDAGDAILRGVAQLIAAGTRQTDYVARVGGEEFAILLPETALFDGLQFAEKLRSSVAATTIRVGDIEHHVTISIGIANVPHSQVKDADELYRAADQALYRAKANGRNRVEMERRRNRLFATPLRSDRRSPQQSALPTLPRTPEAQC
ncbi:MAG TPA: GGDEF domain-containing protein, partial [Thermoanaerobaculia bacterium]|nr:GGDEF domain-containing protein [Thermoanaerobaculia bacterium]